MTGDNLNEIIVAAKRATYIGDGQKAASSRLGSHDLSWREGRWSYLDSYFGGTNFSGQEVVWRDENPVWAMSYYGYILRHDLIDAHRAGAVIKAALSRLYDVEKRFLGGYRHDHHFGLYIDENEGDSSNFRGREWIEVDGIKAYELLYHGGTIIE